MSAWKSAVIKARKESAKPPAGFVTIDAIAEDMGVNRDRARDEVKHLIALGRAERIPGKLVNDAGCINATYFYRLVTAPVAKSKKPKRS
jgi:hypothetical protein